MYRCSVLVHQEPGSNRVLGTKDIVREGKVINKQTSRVTLERTASFR